MFNRLTRDLLDLTSRLHGDATAPFAVSFDCCSCSCCGCITWC